MAWPKRQFDADRDFALLRHEELRDGVMGSRESDYVIVELRRADAWAATHQDEYTDA